ncbi:MAG TPA: M15 family metallopeptidase [Patescibacteria group bacterium]|nr:M15 family metallopeptidase [Patescibacteria group bacterium]
MQKELEKLMSALDQRRVQLVVPIHEGDVLRKRKSIAGWKTVEIQESNEDLTNLAREKRLRPFIRFAPQYYRQEIPGSVETMWVRTGVAQALYRAALLLPTGCQFEIWDAWRPAPVQKRLFDQYLEVLRKKMKGLTEAELREETQKYVSLPSDDPTKPSPHSTGGAIDLTIVGPDGKTLNMGVPFDYFGSEARTTFYEEKLREGDTAFSEEEKEILANRRLLYSVMITAGFTNYEEEHWHYDFGDQFWGRIKEQPAIYGKAMPLKICLNDEPCTAGAHLN